MKHTVSIMMFALLVLLVGCKSKNDAVQPKDWDNTTYLISSNDEQSCQTYYKPYSGYIGDVMPMYDIKTQSFKIYYLQDYRPNPAGTYHPVWGLSYTADKGYINDGEVAQLVAHHVRDVGVGRSSRLFSTKKNISYNRQEQYLSKNACAAAFASGVLLSLSIFSLSLRRCSRICSSKSNTACGTDTPI